jgi:ribosomal protein L29
MLRFIPYLRRFLQFVGQKEIKIEHWRSILQPRRWRCFMKNIEMIAQLEAELNSLRAALELCNSKTDPALVASLRRAIATLERVIADLKSGQKP